ncbi:hypothetical protein SCLARK_001078 [Spiroplasma clarkii]|uniref:Uncharacterized protein n=1 Tax=Spiroplasma clarkii TaxID=2139 RepID=A0A1Y0L0Y8_9MOLU|nr:hypothetical protein [Spiroplasma clarkii]ARU91651.1 hypothetical protein SCLARK_001078 [Spiroplasma clarkii]ATX71046.1 hypothetical protein SCLAR_v1c07290 [Spiroplasma clarkii]
MEKEIFKEIVGKLLELKLVEIRREIPPTTINDLYNYLMNVVLINNQIRDVNDASFLIMNIKVNRIYEYLNLKDVTDKSSDTLEHDLKYILEG